ncbi:hypothetical protein J437_LFUL009511 [Ladona fulva]|uniref:Pop1 N-terminal domain-containing protein n=1 Tax=Ladona fulva TaxID=123851 RepID=A0A8K0K278_LADFU|nr:hypothetical protein J437_LFUL009511 [Ladona fulva]
MSSENPQFDILLGGTEELPQDLTLMRYASNRAQEILSLTEALQEPRKTGLVFQRLPRHMRRRVMSHNAKRMPRQLREAHISQMEKSGVPPKSKRPSRKYRRRPSNLLDAYNRRQKENIWLETHIWHAKRFHMTNKWGYRLANFPNDKSKRACYRAAVNHCLIQDISYYKCIELSGELECISNGLKLLTRDECGRTFCAKTWLNGGTEGSVTVFHSDTAYPCGAIGQVLFLWRPIVTERVESRYLSEEMESSVLQKGRTIWIWIHPSYYKEVLEELMKVFKMKLSSSVRFHKDDLEPSMKKPKLGSSISESESKDVLPNLEVSAEKELDVRLFSHAGPHYEGKGVQMTLLEDKLVRLRLTGPLSQAVLRETFVLAPGRHEEDSSWVTQWEEVFKCQHKMWEMMSRYTSPAMMSPHMVIGLTILDPRCNLPAKRTKAVDQDASESGI